MPSLRDSTLLLKRPGTSVPGSYCAVPAGLVAVFLLNCLMEERLCSSRPTCVIWLMPKF
jgi:hypothetical protein